MRTRSKVILAALSASLLLGLAASSASAGRLSTTNARFRVTWNALRFAEPGGGGITLTCRVTLEGSFHSTTLRKVAGALIGAVTRAFVDSTNCRGNNEPHRASVLQETLPWHVTYEGFGGVLPNITEVTFLIRRYALTFAATILGITGICAYRDEGSPEENFAETATRNVTTGAITSYSVLGGRRARFFRGAPFPEACPTFGGLSGSGETYQLGNTSRITVTLI
jgi:hypothetical protein